MNTIAKFLVEKRFYIVGFMMIITFASIFMMQHVTINQDLTKYLPNNSSMKIGLDKMNKEFSNPTHSSFQIMFKDLTPEEKNKIYQEISLTKGVASVEYDNSNNYNQDNYTLYVVNTNYKENSSQLKSVLNSIKGMYEKNYTIYTATDTTSNPVDTKLLNFMLPIAGMILIIILLTMCASWFEPILFIFTITIAIIINMGTNLFLHSVSNMTFSIAAVMQLILSMDYSIILMNRYRQEKAKLPDGNKITAMKNAISKSFKAILSSSATTIVGLLALIFMNFKIGEDMGIVFAKGVFISLIAIFTLLPSLILWSDKILTKTLKKPVYFKKDKIDLKGGAKNV